MRFWTAYAVVALSISAKAWSAGNGHHGSITDLIAPLVNVIVLAGFLIWKLKGPLKKHFDSMSEDVANTLERASLKSKEAQILLENEERKLSNLVKEIKGISQQAETDIFTYEQKLSKEVEDKSHKLKTDADAKIRADKKAMMDDLNGELINQVIAKTKSTIKTNKDYQSKVSNKLLQGL